MNLNTSRRQDRKREKENRKDETIDQDDRIPNSNHMLQETRQIDAIHRPKKNRMNLRSNIRQQHRSLSRSRSRSPINIVVKKSWKSTNAFINFMQDFRKQRQSGQKSSTLLRLGGVQWRHMSQEEKQPYIDAANTVKQQKQQRQHSDESDDQQRTKSDSNIDPKKIDMTQKKLSHEEYEEWKQNKKKSNMSDMESDTMTTGSAETAVTEED